jgi:hypothetical protein
MVIKKWIKYLMTFSLIFLCLVPIHSISGSISSIWDEDFEVQSINELSGWVFQGYEQVSGKLAPVDHGFEVMNGELIAPSDPSYSPLHRALYDSNTVYGNWSFDWRPSSTEPTYDVVEFIFTDTGDPAYNSSGRDVPESGIKGYALILASQRNAQFNVGPGVFLVKIPAIIKSNTSSATIHCLFRFKRIV